jgi:hypothetical protein
MTANSKQPTPEQRRLALLQLELGYFENENDTDRGAQSAGAAPDAAVPSWQRSAPTAQLYVPKDQAPLNPNQEPYPKKFQDIFEFLQSGKEIPGIRKIPDTVIEDPAIKTQGVRAAPLKPWEKRAHDDNVNSEQLPPTDDATLHNIHT